MTYTLNWEQLEWMWTALTTWGSNLLHICIQLLPYAIAITIILIIFLLIKNWSKLSNKWESWYYKKWSLDNVFWKSPIWEHRPRWDETPWEMMSISKKQAIARKQLHEMNTILNDPANEHFYESYWEWRKDYYLWKDWIVYYKEWWLKDEENNWYSDFNTDSWLDFINRKHKDFMRYYDDYKYTWRSSYW